MFFHLIFYAKMQDVCEKCVFDFYTEIQDGRKEWQENDFWKKMLDDSADTLGVKHFTEIALSCTISYINAFLHLTQKF